MTAGETTAMVKTSDIPGIQLILIVVAHSFVSWVLLIPSTALKSMIINTIFLKSPDILN